MKRFLWLGLVLLVPACVLPVAWAVGASERRANGAVAAARREEDDVNTKLTEMREVLRLRDAVFRDKVLPLLNRNIPARGWTRRDREDARDALADLRRKVNDIAAKLSAPYTSESLDRIRRRARDFIGEIDREAALFERYLAARALANHPEVRKADADAAAA